MSDSDEDKPIRPPKAQRSTPKKKKTNPFAKGQDSLLDAMSAFDLLVEAASNCQHEGGLPYVDVSQGKYLNGSCISDDDLHPMYRSR